MLTRILDSQTPTWCVMVHPVDLATKVDHLSTPDAYPFQPARVETKETHMSWVFLTGSLAFKMKKPEQGGSYDWRSLEQRREDCMREVALNRRLAADVYYGTVALVVADGNLALEGDGEPVEWLVKMRRLPERLMLDWLIEHRCVEEAGFRRAVELICRFYRASEPYEIAPQKYCDRLTQDLKQSRSELSIPRYGQNQQLVDRVHELLLKYVERQNASFEERVRGGRVIDAHGDLRPEHLCLETPPVVIDCLQFDERLRVLDTASELSFLALECERLGAPHLNDAIWSVYEEFCQDQPPPPLLQFYKAYHACLRAMVSVWHLKDSVADSAKWIHKADRYLRMAESCTERLVEQ